VRSPLFAEFAQRWLADLAPQWRLGSRETSAWLVDTYLLPSLGRSRVDAIGREALYSLRRQLAACGRRDGGALSPKVVNESMRLAGRILDEAARRYKFESPSAGVGPVPAAPTEVEPFTVAQMRAILTQVDGQDRALLTVAFGTGLRPGEIAGLQWSDVNLGGCTLQVRRTRSRGRVGAPKTAAGRREVRLTAGVTAALREQALRTRATGESVFQTAALTPIDIKNFAARVWHPALRALGLPPRRLYTTRHTYASLALAAGESPAWIARQLGHENTEPLFRIYGHFVPRTGSRDGAAFERLVAAGVLPPVQLEIFDAD
jgi:integrase